MDIIRRDTDYAFRALIYLADSGDGQTTGAELARVCDIPTSFAYKILRKLSGAGFVTSGTGRSGGFRLGMSLKDISLRKVIDTVQGAVTVSDCVINSKACSRRKKCPVSNEWRSLQQGIVDFLDGTTLQDTLTAEKRSTRRTGIMTRKSGARL